MAGNMFMDLTFELQGDFKGDLPGDAEAPMTDAVVGLKEWCHTTTQGEMMEPRGVDSWDPEDEEGEGRGEEEVLGHWEAPKDSRFKTELYSYVIPDYMVPPLGTEQDERADRLVECSEPVHAWVLEAAAAFAEEVREMRDYELECAEEELGLGLGWVAQMNSQLQEMRADVESGSPNVY